MDKRITMKPSDKSGAVVVMDTSQNIGEIRRQLGDQAVYEKLKSDPTNEDRDRGTTIIDKALKGGLINERLQTT